MSSIITASRFLVESQDPAIWVHYPESLRVLSEVIQNLSNGYYRQPWSQYIHYLDLRDGTRLMIGTIVWISIGDGQELLSNKKSLLDRIAWLRWKIWIVYKIQDKQDSIDITAIIGISRKSILETIQDSSTNPMTLVTPKSTTRTSHNPQGVYA